MANSPLVSIRIPPEILERIERLAQELYPSRRAGKNPNRSQVILDAIVQFLERQEESSDGNTLNLGQPIDEEQLNNILLDKPIDHEQLNTLLSDEQISKEQLNRVIPLSSKYKMLQQYPPYMEPPIREYIDWWFTYFSYMKKLTDLWFGVK